MSVTEQELTDEQRHTAEQESQQEDRGATDEAPNDERCEAETTAGGTLYRCALSAEHEGEHSFSPIEAEQRTAPVDDDKAKRQAVEKLANEAERHRKRIGEIMGEDANFLIPCELCMPQFAGYRFDGSPDEATITRVRVAIGMPDLTNYAPSSTERQCDDCRGLGRVRTGSTVQQYETATCDACAGKGFVASRPRMNGEPAELPAEPGPAAPAELHDDGIRRDMFGTPEGDPDYNLMPGVRARPVEYWQIHRG
jgi:hypothetical protein